MCFAHDEEGRNPVHVAAIKGHVVVVNELVRAMPRVAKERAGNEGRILHLCVKYDKLECLTMLLNYVGDSELLNCKDCEGNTVLHLAVADKQIEMLKFLLSKKYWMDKNSKNSNGLTPMDTFHQSRKDPKHKAVHQVLRRANLRESSKLQVEESWNKHLRWLEDHRSSLMFVASLIAQMAFKARLNFYLAACSVSLFSSLSIILMLVRRLPCRKIMVLCVDGYYVDSNNAYAACLFKIDQNLYAEY